MEPVNFERFEYAGHDSVSEPQIEAGSYRNPILSGCYPDPSVCRLGDDFYLINSTFAYFPGIPIFQSRDLVHWQQIGDVIHRPEQLPYDGIPVTLGIFAPAITARDGTFYVVCTMVGRGEKNFVVTATNPAGPWSDPVFLPFEGIDPSLFFDEDGRAWLVNNGPPEGTSLYEGHRAIWLQEFNPVSKKMIGPRTALVDGGVDISKKPMWLEGPNIFRNKDWYYLCCAEGGTSLDHSQVIFRSRYMGGPYAPWIDNPILTQRDLDANAPQAVTCTGHASLVVGPDDNWWAIFLGVRPYHERFSLMGRETFLLPVKWTDDGWPVILPQGERVPLVAKAPVLTSIPLSDTTQLTGAFTLRDDFIDAFLSPLWMMLRTPTLVWWKSGSGRLALTPQTELLSGSGNPSFLARRVQHANFSATISLKTPSNSGVSAGLVVFQNETHHYFLAVRKGIRRAFIYLERANGGPPKTIASARLPEIYKVDLKIEANEEKCSFSYAIGSDSWKSLLADGDATFLTTEIAGGFVGATVGPHVRIDAAATDKNLPEAT